MLLLIILEIGIKTSLANRPHAPARRRARTRAFPRGGVERAALTSLVRSAEYFFINGHFVISVVSEYLEYLSDVVDLRETQTKKQKR